jgi:chromate transport protein ChrA
VTETQLIKIAAAALFVGVPALLAAVLQRLLDGVKDATLRRAFWGLLGVAGVAVLVLLVLNPGRSGSADLKIFGNILAGAIIASFFAALVVGRIVHGRSRV